MTSPLDLLKERLLDNSYLDHDGSLLPKDSDKLDSEESGYQDAAIEFLAILDAFAAEFRCDHCRNWVGDRMGEGYSHSCTYWLRDSDEDQFCSEWEARDDRP